MTNPIVNLYAIAHHICMDSHTKIIATLGPATNSAEMIEKLCKAGADVFRINFSHGAADDHRKTAQIIRDIEKKTGRPIGIIADMQGPKLRIGTFTEGAITLEQGQNFRFDLDEAAGDNTRVNLPHPEVLKVLKPDAQIFLDDGNVRATILKTDEKGVDVRIDAGTKLSDKKGLNVPGVLIPIPALTPKDHKDLLTAIDMGADWIAQSFVQTVEDVQQAKTLIDGRAALMVKLEKPAALEDLDNIIALADGVMIARGDLGVEIPPEHVPAAQKNIIRKCRAAAKPVVVATQMLESMTTNARPTRAEASDVATAVYDGTDAVMLSAETAVGQYPERAVTIMSRICKTTEADENYAVIMDTRHPETEDQDASDAIATAAYYVAQDVEAAAIITYTTSGSTALRMSRQRPFVPVLCMTSDQGVARRLAVSYGVHAVHMADLNTKISADLTGSAKLAGKTLQDEGLAQPTDTFVMTAGVPFGQPGSTNLLRIGVVGG